MCVTRRRRRPCKTRNDTRRQRLESFPIATELAYDICFRNVRIRFRDLTTRIVRSQSKYSDRTTEYFLSLFEFRSLSLSRSTRDFFHFLVPNIGFTPLALPSFPRRLLSILIVRLLSSRPDESLAGYVLKIYSKENARLLFG